MSADHWPVHLHRHHQIAEVLSDKFIPLDVPGDHGYLTLAAARRALDRMDRIRED